MIAIEQEVNAGNRETKDSCHLAGKPVDLRRDFNLPRGASTRDIGFERTVVAATFHGRNGAPTNDQRGPLDAPNDSQCAPNEPVVASPEALASPKAFKLTDPVWSHLEPVH